MKLYNTLKREIEAFTPLNNNKVSIYSCGPTVYDHIHIGNLASFIYADTLSRTLRASGYEVDHVINFTDVDDKTIKRSKEKYPTLNPKQALKKLTTEYSQLFLDDMRSVGCDVESIKFINATDHIEDMKALITKLHEDGFAYIADDGVYFSIKKYRDSGKKYGQLLAITDSSTSSARIQNDEYDKDSPHDFALWKTGRADEPIWDFTLDGKKLDGRPGWHIECSAMSAGALGQPFDIHTGGVDLIFPHHENEIAQSTAGKANPTLANIFLHNEHLLVDGKKMSKSLNNFFTLQDIRSKGFDPLAFRLMVLQSHYRSQSNFTWTNLEATQNRLKDIRAMADLVFQTRTKGESGLVEGDFLSHLERIKKAIEDDINLPEVLKQISDLTAGMLHFTIEEDQLSYFKNLLDYVDQILGLDLTNRSDISDAQKLTLNEREKARDSKSWVKSDRLRDKLAAKGIGVRDTEQGQVWFRL